MRLLATLIAVVAFVSSSLAAPQVLSIPAQGGTIRITPIFHAAMQIEYRGKVIHVDPFSMGNYFQAKKEDIVFITHTHPDHLDMAALKKISGSSTHFVAPQSVFDELKRAKMQAHLAMPLSNGQTIAFDTNDPTRKNTKFRIGIEAVPMYNLVRGPKPGQYFHPKGQFNGYLLTLGGKRLYIAGDTEATPEMKALKNIDVAFLPMNLPYTMTPQEAATAARAFKPKMAVPYHYRYPFDKPNTNPQQFQAALRGTKIGVKLFDWYRK